MRYLTDHEKRPAIQPRPNAPAGFVIQRPAGGLQIRQERKKENRWMAGLFWYP
jgi:hypothetical protein